MEAANSMDYRNCLKDNKSALGNFLWKIVP